MQRLLWRATHRHITRNGGQPRTKVDAHRRAADHGFIARAHQAVARALAHQRLCRVQWPLWLG